VYEKKLSRDEERIISHKISLFGRISLFDVHKARDEQLN
jgi:hypothetical protein